MRIFLDANVIISVLNKEYPLFNYSSRILSLANNKNYSIFTSALSLAIAFYFSSKKSGQKRAKEKINILMQYIGLTTINVRIAREAILDKKFHDFEDGLQYYSAKNEKCQVIITSDIDDFYASEIKVMECEQFINYYGENKI